MPPAGSRRFHSALGPSWSPFVRARDDAVAAGEYDATVLLCFRPAIGVRGGPRAESERTVAVSSWRVREFGDPVLEGDSARCGFSRSTLRTTFGGVATGLGLIT